MAPNKVEWLVFSDNADNDALYVELIGVDGFVIGIGRFEAIAEALAVEFFKGGFAVFQKSDDNLAVAGLSVFLDEDVIAGPDMLIDHTIAFNLQGKDRFGGFENCI